MFLLSYVLQINYIFMQTAHKNYNNLGHNHFQKQLTIDKCDHNNLTSVWKRIKCHAWL